MNGQFDHFGTSGTEILGDGLTSGQTWSREPEDEEPLGSTPWTEPQKWLGFFFGALLVVIIAGELIG